MSVTKHSGQTVRGNNITTVAAYTVFSVYTGVSSCAYELIIIINYERRERTTFRAICPLEEYTFHVSIRTSHQAHATSDVVSSRLTKKSRSTSMRLFVYFENEFRSKNETNRARDVVDWLALEFGFWSLRVVCEFQKNVDKS